MIIYYRLCNTMDQTLYNQCTAGKTDYVKRTVLTNGWVFLSPNNSGCICTCCPYNIATVIRNCTNRNCNKQSDKHNIPQHATAMQGDHTTNRTSSRL